MLAKLERAYLSILRVVILIAATIALIVAGFSAITAIPPLLRWSGLTETTKLTGGTLAEFIDEQKITETTSSQTTTNDSDPFVLPDIKAAAQKVATYLGKRSAITEKQWQTGLQQTAMSIPLHSVEYAESVNSLSDQLKSSKGKPLSEERVVQLIDWHKVRFEGDVAARAAAETEGNAKFWVNIALAGAAFLSFILIIFVFIFVKIERSLRVVQTTHVASREDFADA